MEVGTHAEFGVLFGEPHLLDPNSIENYVEVGVRGLEILSSKPLYFQRIQDEILGEGYVFGQLFSTGYAKISEHTSEEGSTSLLNPETFIDLQERTIKKIETYFDRGQKFEDLLKIRELNPGFIWIGSASISGYATLYGHLDLEGNYDSFIIDSDCFFNSEIGAICLQTRIDARFKKPQIFKRMVPIESPNRGSTPISSPTIRNTPERIPLKSGIPGLRPSFETLQISPFTNSPLLKPGYPSPQIAPSPKTIYNYSQFGKHTYNPETDTLTYNAKYYFPNSEDGKIAEKIPLSPGEATNLETEIRATLERYPETQVRVNPETKEIIITFTGERLQDTIWEFVGKISDIFSSSRYEITRKNKTYTLYVK